MRQLITGLFCLFGLSAFAQYDTYSVNEPNFEPCDSCTEKLYLKFDNFNYLRNHEYFSKILDGYTLFGTQLNPQLSFFPHKKLNVTGGVWLNKEFGRDEIKVQPTFTVKWIAPNEKNTFLFGNIQGNINHGFLDPLYDYERLITFRNEYGAQWLHKGKRLQHDLFINWENMIHRGDTTQEELTAGLSLGYKLFQTKPAPEKGNFKALLKLQSYLNHNGGQINVTTKNLTTYSNTAIGLQMIHSEQKGFIKGHTLEGYYIMSNNLSPNPDSLFTNGNALLVNWLFKTRSFIDVMFTYWSSEKFVSSKGNPLYQNTSFIGDPYSPKKRELLFARFIYDQKIFDHFYAQFRLEPYYSFDESLFEYSYSLFITYRQNFLLKETHKKQTGR